MLAHRPRLSLTELLLQPELIEQLRDHFRYIQDSLTTTIHEAADLTHLSEAQLRYAEARGLLAPNRAVDTSAAEPRIRGQRRYTVDNLLRAHLISRLIDHGYSLTEIATYMENNTSIIHELLETTTLGLRSVLNSADDILYRRFFIPRVLYYALSLIFERDAIADAGIIFPVRATPAELADITPGEIEEADDLIHLGHIFVAWRARGRPLTTFITAGNPFEREQKVRLSAFADRATAIPGRATRSAAPTHAYIALAPQAELELDQADSMLTIRQQRDPQRHTGARMANPRAVAGRLIQYVQQLCCSDIARAGQMDSLLSDVLLYNAPDLVNPLLGDALLNRLADTMVELGGRRQAPDCAQDGAQDDAATRWRFSCVLMPRELNAPLRQQALVVRAQSKQGPHRVGVTTAAPSDNGGLSFRAFSSGRVAYRAEVIPLDPAVSYVAEESPIGSAIAAPAVEGHGAEQNQPPAVIYIASSEKNAFDDDDFLMTRVMGRLVGEIVQTYNSRGHLPSALTDTLADPELVDGYFAEFRSELSFMTDLTNILKALVGDTQEPDQDAAFTQDVQTLTLIGLDVNNYSSIQRRQGDRVARMLTREIGARVKKRMNGSLTHGVPTARLYRPWGDRFYLLMRDYESDTARQRAEHIQQEISVAYHLDGDTLTSSPSAAGKADSQSGGIQVGIRMVGATLTRDALLTQLEQAGDDAVTCAAGLSRLLDDGLRQANESPDRSLWWNAERHSF